MDLTTQLIWRYPQIRLQKSEFDDVHRHLEIPHQDATSFLLIYIAWFSSERQEDDFKATLTSIKDLKLDSIYHLYDSRRWTLSSSDLLMILHDEVTPQNYGFKLQKAAIQALIVQNKVKNIIVPEKNV